MFEWFNKRKVKNLIASVLAAFSLLSIARDANAVSRETVQSFLDTKQSYRIALKGDNVGVNALKSQVNAAMKKLEDDVHRDIITTNFEHAIEALDAVHELLTAYSHVGDFRTELTQVINLKEQVKKAMNSSYEGRNVSNINFDNFDLSREGVFKKDKRIFIVKILNVNASRNVSMMREIALGRANWDLVAFFIHASLGQKENGRINSVSDKDLKWTYQNQLKDGNWVFVFEMIAPISINDKNITVNDVLRVVPELK